MSLSLQNLLLGQRDLAPIIEVPGEHQVSAVLGHIPWSIAEHVIFSWYYHKWRSFHWAKLSWFSWSFREA